MLVRILLRRQLQVLLLLLQATAKAVAIGASAGNDTGTSTGSSTRTSTNNCTSTSTSTSTTPTFFQGPPASERSQVAPAVLEAGQQHPTAGHTSEKVTASLHCAAKGMRPLHHRRTHASWAKLRTTAVAHNGRRTFLWKEKATTFSPYSNSAATVCFAGSCCC